MSTACSPSTCRSREGRRDCPRARRRLYALSPTVSPLPELPRAKRISRIGDNHAEASSHRARERQARTLARRNGRSRDHHHGGRPSRAPRPREARRLAHADGYHSPGQAHRRPHAAHRGRRTARAARRHRARRLGHLPRQRLRGGAARQSHRGRSSRADSQGALRHQADARSILSRVREAPERHSREDRHVQGRHGRAAPRRHSRLSRREEGGANGRRVVRLDRDVSSRAPRARDDRQLRGRAPRERSGHLQRSALHMGVPEGAGADGQRGAQPHPWISPPPSLWRERRARRSPARTSRPARRS
jgi:hypothetical protein